MVLWKEQRLTAPNLSTRLVNYIQTEFQRCSLGEENLNYKNGFPQEMSGALLNMLSCSANAVHAQSLDDHFEAKVCQPFGLGRAVERVNVDLTQQAWFHSYFVSTTVNARSLLIFMEAVLENMVTKNNLMKRNGFTLIELLVVVAIIGVLAAVGVIAFNGFLNK